MKLIRSIHKTILRLGCLLTLCVMLLSCEKELDFHYHDIPALPVAEVFLTQDGAYSKLTHTTPMGEPLDTVPQTDGSITLNDLTSGEMFPLLPDQEGIYRSATPGVPGHEYQIIIEREGKRFEATGRMTPEVPITGLSFTSYKMPYGDSGLLDVKLKDIDPEIGTAYWIRLMRNGKIWKWSMATDYGAQDGIVTCFFTLGKINEQPEDEDDLEDGEVITALVTAISRDFLNYLQAVSSDASGNIMFEGGKCLGFFLPAYVSEASVTYRLEDLISN